LGLAENKKAERSVFFVFARYNPHMKSKTRHDAARCDVALLVDIETGRRDARNRFVPDRGSVEAQVLRALASQHRRVSVVPFDAVASQTLDELRALRPRTVFNLTELINFD